MSNLLKLAAVLVTAGLGLHGYRRLLWSLKSEEGEVGVEPLLNAEVAAKHLDVYTPTLLELVQDGYLSCDSMTTQGPLFRRLSLDAWKQIRENQLILHAYASQTNAPCMEKEFGRAAIPDQVTVNDVKYMLLTTMIPASTVAEWGSFIVILLVLLWLSFRNYDHGGGYPQLNGLVNLFCWIVTIAYVLIWGGIFWW